MIAEVLYTVVWSPLARTALREMIGVVRGSGREREFAETLRVVDGRLCRAPLDFGEIYRSHGSVVMHAAVLTLLGLDFAVDTARRLVLI
jgi:hypothetical protein